jgi:hypothetical protein
MLPTPKTCIALLVATLLNAFPVGADNPLKLRVSSRISSAPADIFVYVTIEPRHENRVLVISAESDDFFRSSDVQLNGEDSATVNVIRFRQLPSGTYDISAMLLGDRGQRTATARLEITVV